MLENICELQASEIILK